MNSKWLRRFGLLLTAALFLGALLGNVLAMSRGEVWVGENYWNQVIPTLLQFIVLVFIIGFGLYWIVRNWRWWL